MKYVCFILFGLLHWNVSAHAAIDRPMRGSFLRIGDAIVIEWRVLIEHDPENWDLYFSPDGGGTWQVIEEDMPLSQLSRQWVVPNSATENGKLRIVQDNFDADYENIISVVIGLDKPEDFVDPLALKPGGGSFLHITSSNFQIQLSHSQKIMTNLSAQLFSLEGKKIANFSSPELLSKGYELSWQVPFVSNGLYILLVKADGILEKRKIWIGQR